MFDVIDVCHSSSEINNVISRHSPGYEMLPRDFVIKPRKHSNNSLMHTMTLICFSFTPLVFFWFLLIGCENKLTWVDGSVSSGSNRDGGNRSEKNNHDDNNIRAIIVSSSRYWFNYRHANNALGFYYLLKQNGISDDNIILMLADEYAANSRNPYKNRMHANGIAGDSWYSDHSELDYRGSDVTVQVFLDALTGTAPKALRTDENSKLLVYLTGHGGDNFFKFQDEEELTSQDIATIMDLLYENKKFDQALFIADTCQAFTLFDKLSTPNVLALGTSLRDQNAYAHHSGKL